MEGMERGIIRGEPPRILRRIREGLYFRYYDAVRIGTTPISSYKFFSDVSGKTKTLTNMPAGGFLTLSEKFEINAITAFISPRIIDWATIGNGINGGLTLYRNLTVGHWILKIGDKEYNVGTIAEILSESPEIIMNEATAGNHLITAFGSPQHKASGLYPLAVPVVIKGGTPFHVEVNWDNAVATANGEIFFYVVLLGKRERPVM